MASSLRRVVALLALSALLVGCAQARKPVGTVSGEAARPDANQPAESPSQSPPPGAPVTTGPNEVPGGVGPVVSGGAVPLPTVTSTAPRPGVGRPNTPVTTKPVVQPGPPTVPTSNPLVPIVPKDTDPNLALWCPLADEVITMFLHSDTLKPATDGPRLVELLNKSLEVAPAAVKDKEIAVLKVFDAMARSGRMGPPGGAEDAARALINDLLGPGAYDQFKADVLYVLAYYTTNCGPK